jgi:hypothetical protein
VATVPTTLTASVGNKNTAANWNTYERDAIAFLLDPPRVKAYQTTTATTFVTAVGQVVLFDAESASWDTDTMHSTSVSTGRVTFTTAGRYLLTVAVSFAGNVTGVREIQLRLNAATVYAGGTQLGIKIENAVSAGSHHMHLTYEGTFAATDYVEVFGRQTSGGNLATNLGEQLTFVTARRVSA